MQNEQAFIYKTDGEIIPVLPKNKKAFTLTELQKIVGGYIELIYLNDGRVMVINEEGKIDGLEYNLTATLAYGNDVIVGNVLVSPYKFID
jgi:hypothetical protein